MMTVNEVSKISGVSIRALHHYDNIGLLPATEVSDNGYRYYDEKALERLQMVLLFKELEFPLNEIKTILDDSNFDRSKALEQQIHLLELRKEHLENLIDLARGIKMIGVKKLSKASFDAFDTKKIDEYAKKAKASWGKTDAWKEYEKKSEGRTDEDQKALNLEMMSIFAEFGEIKDSKADSAETQALVKKLQDHITENYYQCTKQILSSLGMMHAGGGDMHANIDKVGGEGCAEFAGKAIEIYCAKQEKLIWMAVVTANCINDNRTVYQRNFSDARSFFFSVPKECAASRSEIF